MSSQAEGKKVFLQTFGCQMNQYDSEKILEQLGTLDYARTGDPRQADLILINTCAIREKSEHKVYSLLGSLNRPRARKAGAMIAVGGCVAQQKGEEILARAKQVNLVFGTDNIFELPDLIARASRGERVVQTQWRTGKGKVDNFITAFPPPREWAPLIKASIAITKG